MQFAHEAHTYLKTECAMSRIEDSKEIKDDVHPKYACFSLEYYCTCLGLHCELLAQLLH